MRISLFDAQDLQRLRYGTDVSETMKILGAHWIKTMNMTPFYFIVSDGSGVSLDVVAPYSSSTVFLERDEDIVHIQSLVELTDFYSGNENNWKVYVETGKGKAHVGATSLPTPNSIKRKPLVVSPFGTTVTVATNTTWSSPTFNVGEATHAFLYAEGFASATLKYGIGFWFEAQTPLGSGLGAGGFFQTYSGSLNDGGVQYVDAQTGSYTGARISLVPHLDYHINVVNESTTDPLTFQGLGVMLYSGNNM